MAQVLQITCSAALYHVTSPGNEGKNIFKKREKNGKDRKETDFQGKVAKGTASTHDPGNENRPRIPVLRLKDASAFLRLLQGAAFL